VDKLKAKGKIDRFKHMKMRTLLSSILAITKIKRKSGGKLATTKAYYFVHTCMIKRKTIKQNKTTTKKNQNKEKLQ